MNTNQQLRWVTWWHAIGAAMVLTISAMTLTPADSLIFVFSLWDKLMHFAAYAVLGAWYVMVLARLHYLKLWAALVTLGIALELLQGLVPGRLTEGFDMVANTLGATAGTALGLTPWRNFLLTVEQLCQSERTL